MADDPDLVERQLKLELMQMDLNLKTKQAFWETPRNIAILLGVAVTVAGYVGYRAGSEPQRPIVIQMLPAPTNPAAK